MKLRLLAEAAQELYDAAAYYERQQEGLGRRLEAEFHQHVAWIIQNSFVPRLRRKKYRRVNREFFRITSHTSSVMRRYASSHLATAVDGPSTG